MTFETTEIVTFFVISDSAGETATKLAQATMAQYPASSSIYSDGHL